LEWFKARGIEKLKEDCPYQIGDKVRICYKWFNEIDYKRIYFATIKDILEPKRIGDIEPNLIVQMGLLFEPVLEYPDYMREFKDWFNKQFAEPKPVKCCKCDGSGVFVGTCPVCNDTGIEKYISYVYDDETKKLMDLNAYENGLWNNRPLEIISNPFVWNIKVGAE
jgi:hypothetical protein